MVNNIIDFFIMLLNYIVLMIAVQISVAFVTLLERKILGNIQIRKGPNKIGYLGLLQPFADALKLFSKEQTMPVLSNFLPYYLSPVFSLFTSLIIWMTMPFMLGLKYFNLSILFFLCCLSFGVYSTMAAGWSSNSKYSLLGSLRAVAQTISYEISLAIILLSPIFMVNSFDLYSFNHSQEKIWLLWLMLPLALLWLASCLAETNRTPFDFAEGESELLSGFNTEYSSGGFALLFMAEYVSILFMSTLFVILFLGANPDSTLFYCKLSFIVFVFVWTRGTLPRLRYDKLMFLAWKSFLQASLNYLIFFMGLSMMFFCLEI